MVLRAVGRMKGSGLQGPSRPARLAAKSFMHQHLEEGLVSYALSRCDFSGLGYIGFGQSQRNLDAGDLPGDHL